MFGAGALAASRRVGSDHFAVDDRPWHVLGASGETVVRDGRPPGRHTVLSELADPARRGVTRVAVGPRLDGTFEVAGPDRFRSDAFARQDLRACNDPRELVAVPGAVAG